MASRVALATAARLPDLERDSRALLPELRARGVEPVVAIWTDPHVDWSSFDMVVVRNTWDYADRIVEWDTWVGRMRQVTRMWNPPDVVLWNAHKAYLSELADRDVPVISTVSVPRGGAADLPQLLAHHDLRDTIIKPAVGAGGRGLFRVRDSDEARAGQAAFDELVGEGDVMLQPFLPAIVSEGELSVIYI